jgi:nucleoside-diphosphate-sugar epimerase
VATIRRVLIAGCGDLGLALARLLLARGIRVDGLRRSKGRQLAGMGSIHADLTRPDTLQSVAAPDAVVYCPTPAAGTADAYREVFVTGLKNLLEAPALSGHPLRLLYISSTAVYGQDDGSKVDERAETRPQRFNGEILLTGENLARERVHAATMVRLGGLYGPGRTRLIDGIRSGRASCQCEPPRWTNRVHVEDAAGILDYLLNSSSVLPIINGVDSSPASECEVMDWLADRLGGAPVARVTGKGQGKRVISRELAGYQYRYPDFRRGYTSMLETEQP